jgi:hypothetical protein
MSPPLYLPQITILVDLVVVKLWVVDQLVEVELPIHEAGIIGVVEDNG